MKTAFYLFVLALLVVSCNSDDAEQNNTAALEGPWSLVNVEGGIAGVDDDFDIGLIIWNFDSYTQLTVTNNNTVNVVFDGLPSGIYEYRHLTSGQGDTSFLDIVDVSGFRFISSSSSQFVLYDGMVDGFLLTFRK